MDDHELFSWDDVYFGDAGQEERDDVTIDELIKQGIDAMAASSVPGTAIVEICEELERELNEVQGKYCRAGALVRVQEKQIAQLKRRCADNYNMLIDAYNYLFTGLSLAKQAEIARKISRSSDKPIELIRCFGDEWLKHI